MGRITPTGVRSSIPRRILLKAGLAWTAGAMAVPFPIRARAEMPVKIGMVEPLTGVYATLAESEVEAVRITGEALVRRLTEPDKIHVRDYHNET